MGLTSRSAGALAGAVAAGVALGVSELVCGLAGSSTSLVTAVGTQFIDRFAAALKDLAVSVFGTNDKVALVVGIVVVSIALGAVLGRASVRRPWVGVAGFAAFGVVGLLSYLDDPQSEPAVGCRRRGARRGRRHRHAVHVAPPRSPSPHVRCGERRTGGRSSSAPARSP